MAKGPRVTGKTASPQSHHVGVTSWRSRSLREDVSVGGSLVLERVSLGAFQRVRPRARLRLHDTRVVVVVVVVHQSRRSRRCRVRLPGDSRDVQAGASRSRIILPRRVAAIDVVRPRESRPSGDSPASREPRRARVEPLDVVHRRRRVLASHVDAVVPARSAAPRALGESFPHLQGDALGPHGGRAQAPDGAPRPRTDERHRGHSGDGPGVRHARSRRTGHQTHAPTVDATPPRRAPRIARPQAPIRGAIRRRVDGCRRRAPETETLPRLLRNSPPRRWTEPRHVSGPGRATPSVGRRAAGE